MQLSNYPQFLLSRTSKERHASPKKKFYRGLCLAAKWSCQILTLWHSVMWSKTKHYAEEQAIRIAWGSKYVKPQSTKIEGSKQASWGVDQTARLLRDASLVGDSFARWEMKQIRKSPTYEDWRLEAASWEMKQIRKSPKYEDRIELVWRTLKLS